MEMVSIQDNFGESTIGTDVVLFSGGVDSFIGWFRCGRPDLLYVTIDHRYQALEQRAVTKLACVVPGLDKRLKVSLALERLGQWEKPDAEIPARNLLLAVNAAVLGYSKIGLVCQQDERSIPDRSNHFFAATSNLLSQLFIRDIELRPVFPQWDKTDMVGWFLKDDQIVASREKRISWLKDTVACYRPVLITHSSGMEYPQQCGACPACFRRAIAFSLNGIEEEYASDPWTSEIAKDYLRRALDGKYSEKRCNRTITAMVQHGCNVVNK
jgi:7-cyano-7-deazaguanine synthase in queuosine biosynthesis